MEVHPEIVAFPASAALGDPDGLIARRRKGRHLPQPADRLFQVSFGLVFRLADANAVIVDAEDVHIGVAGIARKERVVRVALASERPPVPVRRVGKEDSVRPARTAQVVRLKSTERTEFRRRTPGVSPPEPIAVRLVRIAQDDGDGPPRLGVVQPVEEVRDVRELREEPCARVRERRPVGLAVGRSRSARVARTVQDLADDVTVRARAREAVGRLGKSVRAIRMIHVPGEDHDRAELDPLLLDGRRQARAVDGIVARRLPRADDGQEIHVVDQRTASVRIAAHVVARQLDVGKRLRPKTPVLLLGKAHVALLGPVPKPRVRPRPVVVRRPADLPQFRENLLRIRVGRAPWRVALSDARVHFRIRAQGGQRGQCRKQNQVLHVRLPVHRMMKTIPSRTLASV